MPFIHLLQAIVNIFILTLLGALSACAQNQLPENLYTSQSNDRQTSNLAYEDKEAIRAQLDHAIKREITVTAPVKKLLRDDVEGLPHQRFLILLSNGTTILIAHDLKYAPAVPIKQGDVLCIHGEYIWNKLGGLIHWTHHSDTAKHESGWIDFNGR
jgi:hypothetical protein